MRPGAHPAATGQTRVMQDGQRGGGYDCFVNMDNICLLTEQKGDGAALEILGARYKYGVALIGLAMLRDDDVAGELGAECEDGNVYGIIEKVTRQVSPIILPMISCLSVIDEETPEADADAEATTEPEPPESGRAQLKGRVGQLSLTDEGADN